MPADILLVVVGMVMLGRGVIKWGTDGKRLVLVGVAMMTAAAGAYFIRQDRIALAYGSGALLAGCVLASAALGVRGWRKPEVGLGIVAIAALLGSIAVPEPPMRSYLVVTAVVSGFISIAFALRAVVTDVLANDGS